MISPIEEKLTALNGRLASYGAIIQGQKYNVETRVPIPATGVLTGFTRMWTGENRQKLISDLKDVYICCSTTFHHLTDTKFTTRHKALESVIYGIGNLSKTYKTLDIKNSIKGEICEELDIMADNFYKLLKQMNLYDIYRKSYNTTPVDDEMKYRIDTLLKSHLNTIPVLDIIQSSSDPEDDVEDTGTARRYSRDSNV